MKKRSLLGLFATLSLLLILPTFANIQVQGEQESGISFQSTQSETDTTPVSLFQQLKDKGLNDAQIADELKKIIENDTDPVGIKIQELKEKGMPNTEIAQELEKYNMHWDLETNAKCFGTLSTNPNRPTSDIKTGGALTDDDAPYYTQRNSGLHTYSESYYGYYIEMKPGSGAVATGETQQHYMTMHIGNSGDFVEVGILHNDVEGYDFYTCNDDWLWGLHGGTGEGKIGYYPDAETYHRFAIYSTGVMNQQGQYEFYVDIDGTRVRTEYLDHAVNSIDNSYEMFTEIVYWPTRTHCVWSNDNSPAIFRDQYVKISSSTWAQYNNNNAPSYLWADFAAHVTVSDSSGSYTTTCWSGFGDEFYDNSIATSRWDELEVNGATASEYGDALRVDVPQGGSGWAQAGYVTKTTYPMSNAQVEVNIADFNELRGMGLCIGLTKLTTSDPQSQSNWYCIMKDRSNSWVYVQKRVDGGAVATLYSGYASLTGTLSIKIDGSTIKFYNGGTQLYSENYALSSYNCYLYAYTSTNRGSSYYGADTFDNFEYHRLF